MITQYAKPIKSFSGIGNLYFIQEIKGEKIQIDDNWYLLSDFEIVECIFNSQISNGNNATLNDN